MGWLTGTLRPWDDERGAALAVWDRLREGLSGPASQVNRTAHYGKGFRADDWSYSVLWEGLGGASGTVCVTIKQAGWESLGPAALDLAPYLATTLRCTRVDLAGDAPAGEGRRPADWFARRDRARTRTDRGEWALTVSGGGDEKLTIGARSSDRYGRIYLGHGGVRHELELKGVAASSTAAGMAAGEPVADLWAAEYVRLVDWGARRRFGRAWA